MKEIAPYTVGEFEYVNESGNKETYLDFDPNSLTYILVNSVKQQQRKIDSLESEIMEIKRMLLSGNPGATMDAKLWQNQPNPADGSTVISYFVPENARTSFLNIYSMSGQLVKSVNISGKGKGNVVIGSKQFPAGTYSYHLIVDGKIADNKKLVLSR